MLWCVIDMDFKKRVTKTSTLLSWEISGGVSSFPLTINVYSPSPLITLCKLYWLGYPNKWLRGVYALASGVWNSSTLFSRSGTKNCFSRLDSTRDNWTGSSQALFSGADYFYSQRSAITFIKQQPLVKLELRVNR